MAFAPQRFNKVVKNNSYERPAVQLGVFGDTQRVPISNADPWDKVEGYTQLGLIDGATEVMKPVHNPPELTNLDDLNKNEYPVQSYMPGMTPAGHKAVGPVPEGVIAENYNPLEHLGGGFRDGWKHAFREGDTVVDGEKGQRYARSVVLDALTNNHPKPLYGSLNTLGKIGATTGRIAGDFIGNGTISKLLWNAHPADITSTAAYNLIDSAGGSSTVRALTGFGAVAALNVGSGNLDPTNIMGLGRSDGFAAASPDKEDPSKTDNVALEGLYRFMGRTGRLLPWEQFHEERPDVSYETYANYQDYLRESGILGLAKGTLEGVNGPEARVMGYRVTPLGAASAAAVVGGTAWGLKRMAAGIRR